MPTGSAPATDLTDGKGNSVATYSHDVFGAIRTQSGGSASEFRFTGEQRDPQLNRNLYYLRARYYDPAIGRFIGRDPLPAANLYAYVGNNPVNSVDPTGLCPNGCESRFQARTLGSIPGPPSAGECPVEPLARARCAHAFLELMYQYIEEVVRPYLSALWLAYEQVPSFSLGDILDALTSECATGDIPCTLAWVGGSRGVPLQRIASGADGAHRPFLRQSGRSSGALRS